MSTRPPRGTGITWEANWMIREATAEDRGAIQRLYEELCPGEPVEVRSGRLAEIAGDSHNHLYVAERDGVVVGTAFVTLCLDPMFGHQPYAVLENIIIARGHRGQGLGSSLLRHVEAMCAARDCSKIMLLSNARRPHAHAFFKRMGYSGAVATAFKKYLGGHHASEVEEGDRRPGV